MKALILMTNGRTVTVNTPDEITCDWIARSIDCEWVEIVRPKRLEKGYVIVCDEEGALHPNFINVAASWLYETDKHGEPIVGHVMILREVMGPEGPEFAGMSDEDAEELAEKYGNADSINEWHMKIRKKL